MLVLHWTHRRAAIVVAIASFTLIGGILYRNRWKIRYVYYMSKRGYKGSAHARSEITEIFSGMMHLFHMPMKTRIFVIEIALRK